MKRSRLNLSVVPVALLVLLAAPFVIYWSDLPNPMAIHWGPGGAPDGSAPPAVLVVALAALFVAMIVAIRRVVANAPGEAPSFVAGLYGIGVLLVVIAWMSVLANRGATVWNEAAAVGWIGAGIGVVAGLAAGAAGWYLSGGKSQMAPRAAGEVPHVDLAEPMNAVWSGRGVGKLTTVIGVAVIVVGLLVWDFAGIVLAMVGIVALMFAVVRVTVSRGGIVVSLGWWGFPMWKVPLDSITQAEVEQVHPMSYGGWGYRLRPGVRAVVVKGGDGLRLVRDSGSDLVYTVDDAATGAGLINALLRVRR